MKIIIAGTTGSIGSKILATSIRNPTITSIIVLSRRAFPHGAELDHPKVQVVVLDNFLEYSPSVLREFKGAAACIWCVGTMRAANITTEVSYPLALANELVNLLAASRSKSASFRFVYLSGSLACQTRNVASWLVGERWRLKGLAEKTLLALASEKRVQGRWETVIARPGRVVPLLGWKTMLSRVIWTRWIIGLDELAVAMVFLATRKTEKKVFSNSELLVRGRSIIDASTIGF